MEPRPIQPMFSSGTPMKTGPLILLVEDEPVVRDVTCEVLEHAGYQVLECANPQDALRLASQHQGQIRLLLTDVVMPGMNGAELAHCLQELQPDLVTVFMSGYAERDVLVKLKYSAAVHIQKPFTIEILLARVAEALARQALAAAPVAS